MAEQAEDPEQEFVNMLFKWFEARGCDLRPERAEGLSATDFEVMLDEHEAAIQVRSAEPVAYLREQDAGTDSACWVVCAKGDPGAEPAYLAE